MVHKHVRTLRYVVYFQLTSSCNRLTSFTKHHTAACTPTNIRVLLTVRNESCSYCFCNCNIRQVSNYDNIRHKVRMKMFQEITLRLWFAENTWQTTRTQHDRHELFRKHVCEYRSVNDLNMNKKKKVRCFSLWLPPVHSNSADICWCIADAFRHLCVSSVLFVCMVLIWNC